MKHLFTIIFLVPVLLSAQGRTSIDFFGAAGYSQQYNSFLRTLDLEISERYIGIYRLGFAVNHQLGGHLSLKAGLQAAQYGFGFRSELMLTDINGNPSGDEMVSFRSATRTNYWEGMVGLRYNFNTPDRWSPYIEVGINAGFLSGGSNKFKLDPDPGNQDGDQEFDDENIDKTAIVGRIGLGTDYGLSERLSLYGMVAFQHHLTKQNLNVEASILPWQGTLELGVRVFIGK